MIVKAAPSRPFIVLGPSRLPLSAGEQAALSLTLAEAKIKFRDSEVTYVGELPFSPEWSVESPHCSSAVAYFRQHNLPAAADIAAGWSAPYHRSDSFRTMLDQPVGELLGGRERDTALERLHWAGVHYGGQLISHKWGSDQGLCTLADPWRKVMVPPSAWTPPPVIPGEWREQQTRVTAMIQRLWEKHPFRIETKGPAFDDSVPLSLQYMLARMGIRDLATLQQMTDAELRAALRCAPPDHPKHNASDMWTPFLLVNAFIRAHRPDGDPGVLWSDAEIRRALGGEEVDEFQGVTVKVKPRRFSPAVHPTALSPARMPDLPPPGLLTTATPEGRRERIVDHYRLRWRRAFSHGSPEGDPFELCPRTLLRNIDIRPDASRPARSGDPFWTFCVALDGARNRSTAHTKGKGRFEEARTLAWKLDGTAATSYVSKTSALVAVALSEMEAGAGGQETLRSAMQAALQEKDAEKRLHALYELAYVGRSHDGDIAFSALEHASRLIAQWAPLQSERRQSVDRWEFKFCQVAHWIAQAPSFPGMSSEPACPVPKEWTGRVQARLPPKSARDSFALQLLGMKALELSGWKPGAPICVDGVVLYDGELQVDWLRTQRDFSYGHEIEVLKQNLDTGVVRPKDIGADPFSQAREAARRAFGDPVEHAQALCYIAFHQFLFQRSPTVSLEKALGVLEPIEATTHTEARALFGAYVEIAKLCARVQNAPAGLLALENASRLVEDMSGGPGEALRQVGELALFMASQLPAPTVEQAAEICRQEAGTELARWLSAPRVRYTEGRKAITP